MAEDSVDNAIHCLAEASKCMQEAQHKMENKRYDDACKLLDDADRHLNRVSDVQLIEGLRGVIRALREEIEAAIEDKRKET